GEAATRRDRIAPDLRDAGVAAEREREVELGEQAADDVFDARLAVERKTPDERAAHAHGVGAERERDEDIGAGPDAAIEEEGEALGNGRAHGRERVERRDRAVDLQADVSGQE